VNDLLSSHTFDAPSLRNKISYYGTCVRCHALKKSTAAFEVR